MSDKTTLPEPPGPGPSEPLKPGKDWPTKDSSTPPDDVRNAEQSRITVGEFVQAVERACDQTHSPDDANDSSTTTDPMPTVDTLQDWHVGRMSDGLNEVRFVLTSDEEARAWAVWIANHDQ